jgi:ribonucleoside-triphosphate reductase
MSDTRVINPLIVTSLDEPIIDIQPQDRMHLTENFLSQWKDRHPDWGPLGEVTYRRTYARKKLDGIQEEWWETVRRVVEGSYTYQRWHCRKLGLPWNAYKAQKSAQTMYRLMFEMKFLPPGRGIWMCGTEYVEKRGAGALNNCAMISTRDISVDFSEPFCFLMDFSMLGVGVGGDCRGAGTVTIKEPKQGDDKHIVPDTREGWVDITRRMLDAFVGIGTVPKEIDYSQVRPEGTALNGFGGTASGPGPLIELVQGIRETLEPLIGKSITSGAIVDLFTRIGKCVVSGNVRRSAIIMLGDPNDSDFAELKDPDLHQKELDNHRWASNNSLFAEIGMDYADAAARTLKNGEPGYLWLNNARKYGRMADEPNWVDGDAVGTNPCGEQTLCDAELCCLVETFPSRHESYDEYENTLKFAYLYAKTITLLPTHHPKTNAMTMRNRRIGCSQSGIIDAMARHGRRTYLNWCDQGYQYLRKLDAQYSDWLCVPRSRKITSVKPSGTVSLLPGVSPGIHYPHSEYYFRTIRIGKTSTMLKPLQKAGYHIEQDVVDPSSMVVYFPIHEQYFLKGKDDVTLWEQMENAAALQHLWADNQVSVTVTFKPHESKDIKAALELFESRLKSVSFLPLEEHRYAQVPYQTITKEEFDAANKKLKTIKWAGVTEHEQTDAYCDGDRCVLPPK